MDIPAHPPAVLVVTGVSGSGKTTVGRLLADRLGWDYADGDDFHSRSNVDRMTAGHPLTDQDRWPWLQEIGRWIDEHGAAGQPAVVACSALKRAYRDLLRRGRPQVRLIFLDAGRDLARRRVAARRGHFMTAALLDSQFADLQRPAPQEQVLALPAELAPAALVERIRRATGL